MDTKDILNRIRNYKENVPAKGMEYLYSRISSLRKDSNNGFSFISLDNDDHWDETTSCYDTEKMMNLLESSIDDACIIMEHLYEDQTDDKSTVNYMIDMCNTLSSYQESENFILCVFATSFWRVGVDSHIYLFPNLPSCDDWQSWILFAVPVSHLPI